MQERVQARAAFTLVELLVVITIIGMLMGLLLPTVGRIRERGRQVQCAANLAGIGKALIGYHKTHNSLPMGSFTNWRPRSSGPDSEQSQGKGSMLHYILPYLDEENIFNLFDFSIDYTKDDDGQITDMLERNYKKYAPSLDVRSYVVGAFVCPSDDYRGLYRDTSPVRALSNYVASAGPALVGGGNNSSKPCQCAEGKLFSDAVAKDLKTSSVRKGPFTRHYLTDQKTPDGKRKVNAQAVTFAMIRDGLTNTILVGETRPYCTAESRGGWAASWNGCGCITTVIPINYDTCTDDTSVCQEDGCRVYNNWNTAIGFKSPHPGGACFVAGDGSTHFLPETIDHEVYQRLGAIDDGEPITPTFKRGAVFPP